MNKSTRIGIVGLLKLDGVLESWKTALEEHASLNESWRMSHESSLDCIWTCSFYGHIEILRSIFQSSQLNAKAKLNQGCFKTGKTPLMIAVERDHYEIVKFLLEECEADQDIPDFALNRPGHVVKSDRIANLLIFTNKTNASGLTPIEVAIINDRVEVIKVALKKGVQEGQDFDTNNLLFKATRSTTEKSVQCLQETLHISEFDSFINCSNGNNLLMESVENGSYEVFKYLIVRGGCKIDFNHRNKNGETITEIAERIGNVGISRHLASKIKNKVLL